MKRLAPLSAVALVSLAATGCGSDDKKSEAAKPASLTITATESGKKATVKAPKTAKAGLTKVTLKNDGKGPHSAQLIRVSGNQTPEDVIKVVSKEGAPIPSWLVAGGGVGTTTPGSTLSVTENLEPGRYVVLDQEGERAPATAELEVTGSKVAANPPKGTGSITAVDYSFTAKGLKTGKNEILFQNNGKQLHHVIAAPFKPGATFEEVKKSAASENGGPPPIDEKNTVGTSVIDGGQKQLVELNLKKKGKYALICFIQDRKGGPPHVAKGMIVETTVK